MTMKLNQIVFLICMFSLFVTTSAFAAAKHLTDAPANITNNGRDTSANPSLVGPLTIVSLARIDTTSIQATFNDGTTFTSMYTDRQNALATALVSNAYVYLYEDTTTNIVYGVALLTN